MFQRLQKGLNLDFLDHKIAEEQEKQKQLQQQGQPGRAKRTPSNAGRGRGSSKRAGSRLRVPDGKDGGAGTNSPSPDDFIIGDDQSDTASVMSTAATAEGGSDDTGGGDDGQGKGKQSQKANDDSNNGNGDLPLEVQQKLAKLDKYTARYQDLLRNYRTAHALNATIEPFEATLREHTPLTSIADPGALVEFLNQRSVQSSMVMEELKNIIKERDELKTKLSEMEKRAKEEPDEAERRAGEASDEAAVKNIIKERDELKTKLSETEERAKEELKEAERRAREAFDEAAGLRKERDEYTKEIDQLKAERDAAKEQEEEAAAQCAQTESQLMDLTSRIKETQQSLEEAAAEAKANLKKYEDEHAENLRTGKYVQREEKRNEVQQNLVKTLKDELKAAQEAKQSVERHAENYKLEINTLESTALVRANIITDLRAREADTESLRKKLAIAEKERDDAKKVAVSKAGHEAAVASLRAQLRSAADDRDKLIKNMIACGKCEKPVDASVDDTVSTVGVSTPDSRSRIGSEATGVSTLPTEIDSEATTPSTPNPPETTETLATPTPADAKKKKKKAKGKKKTANGETTVEAGSSVQDNAQLSVDALLRDPNLALSLKKQVGDNPVFTMLQDALANMKSKLDSKDTEYADIISHHETVIETLRQQITDNALIVRDREDQIAAMNTLLEKIKAEPQVDQNVEHKAAELKDQIALFESRVAEKDKDIAKLQARLKGEMELSEEIENLKEEKETMQESMLEIGKTATDAKHELKQLKEARDRLQEDYDNLMKESDGGRKDLKDAEKAKKALADKCDTLEAEIAQVKKDSAEALRSSERMAANLISEDELEALKTKHSTDSAELAAKTAVLTTNLETKQNELLATQTELASTRKELEDAEKLSRTRFKDLSTLQDKHNKLQLQVKALREKSIEFDALKTELDKTTATVKKLESKEKDLRSEITEYKSQATGKDNELRTLKDRVTKSEEKSTALEESYETARKDLEKTERTRNEAIDERDKLRTDLKKCEDELQKSKSDLDHLQKQVKKYSDEVNTLQDELQLKSAQQASVQSTMDSMQNQNREIATQRREIEEQNASLEEQLAESERNLSERNRACETMRRLLAEADGRADSKVKEMREQLDLAIQERDRAEDDASNIGRRKARELEDLRTKLKAAEAEATRASEAKNAAERREKDFRATQERMQSLLEKAQQEAAETKTAIVQLTESLDESERRCKEVEKENAEVLKTIQEKEAKLDKLQKSYKTMAEELRLARAKQNQGHNSVANSSRSSRDSSRVMSPGPNGNNAPATVDLPYLRQVLLNFFQMSEKKHQLDFVPVLKTMLHFDDKAEQQWKAAISSR